MIYPLPTGNGFFMIEENLNAYILVGGSSRRMGTDKLYLQFEGQTLLERAITTCETCFKEVKLVARNLSSLSSLDYELVQDSPSAKGPMAGIIAALEDCKTAICFVTAVDLPDLSHKVIESLIYQYKDQQYFGLLEAKGLQPLCAIYHKSALKNFYQFARNGDFRMTEAVKALDHAGIALPSDRWRNLNYPQDLAIEYFNG